LAYAKIFDEVMGQQRRNELELYKKISQDELFKASFSDTLKRVTLAS
jgi:type I restriction enzyme R subunit